LAAQPNHGIYGAPDDKFAAGYAGISADNGAKAVTPATRLSARRSGLTASFHPATSERRPRKRREPAGGTVLQAAPPAFPIKSDIAPGGI
jgi:hypothetical protein